jgi:hypothetical protein
MVGVCVEVVVSREEVGLSNMRSMTWVTQTNGVSDLTRGVSVWL